MSLDIMGFLQTVNEKTRIVHSRVQIGNSEEVPPLVVWKELINHGWLYEIQNDVDDLKDNTDEVSQPCMYFNAHELLGSNWSLQGIQK